MGFADTRSMHPCGSTWARSPTVEGMHCRRVDSRIDRLGAIGVSPSGFSGEKPPPSSKGGFKGSLGEMYAIYRKYACRWW